MSREQTESCPFKSRFSGTEPLWLTPQQYLAENMTARLARKEGAELGLRFWETEKWKRHFLLQLRQATSLLKLYSVDAIIKALRTRKGSNIYSFGAKFILDPLVKDEQEKLDRQKAAAQVKAQAEPKPAIKAEAPQAEVSRPAFAAKPTTLDKLKDL